MSQSTQIESLDKNKNLLNLKQRHLLKLLASGYTEEAAAFELNISQSTVKYHKKKIFNKLKVDCTVRAILEALKMNLLSMDDI